MVVLTCRRGEGKGNDVEEEENGKTALTHERTPHKRTRVLLSNFALPEERQPSSLIRDVNIQKKIAGKNSL